MINAYYIHTFDGLLNYDKVCVMNGHDEKRKTYLNANISMWTCTVYQSIYSC